MRHRSWNKSREGTPGLGSKRSCSLRISLCNTAELLAKHLSIAANSALFLLPETPVNHRAELTGTGLSVGTPTTPFVHLSSAVRMPASMRALLATLYWLYSF